MTVHREIENETSKEMLCVGNDPLCGRKKNYKELLEGMGGGGALPQAEPGGRGREDKEAPSPFSGTGKSRGRCYGQEHVSLAGYSTGSVVFNPTLRSTAHPRSSCDSAGALKGVRRLQLHIV